MDCSKVKWIHIGNKKKVDINDQFNGNSIILIEMALSLMQKLQLLPLA